MDTTVTGITLSNKNISDVVNGTPFGTVIKGNIFASKGNIFINIIEGSGTEISGNMFNNPTTGAINILTGAGRTFIGANAYNNFSSAYKVSATYMNLLDTSDKSLISGRIRQQKSGTVSLTADGSNGYVNIPFEVAPIDWSKVSCIAIWMTSTLSDYTSAPTQISWTQIDTLYIRIKVAGKTSGQISYIISESN